MYEIIVRVLRVVACLPRLRILSCLALTRETTPTALARQLGMRLDLVCVHLQRLTWAGLIQRRRSGVWCYCRARSPYRKEAFSARLTAWVCRVLRTPSSSGRVGSDDAADAHRQGELERTIFHAATAFTNVRRLQILRRLVAGESVSVATLTRQVRLSESAASRHLAKLTDRGYVESVRGGRCVTYQLARKFKTRVHEQLFRIVSAEWSR